MLASLRVDQGVASFIWILVVLTVYIKYALNIQFRIFIVQHQLFINSIDSSNYIFIVRTKLPSEL